MLLYRALILFIGCQSSSSHCHYRDRVPAGQWRFRNYTSPPSKKGTRISTGHANDSVTPIRDATRRARDLGVDEQVQGDATAVRDHSIREHSFRIPFFRYATIGQWNTKPSVGLSRFDTTGSKRTTCAWFMPLVISNSSHKSSDMLIHLWCAGTSAQLE